MKRKKIFFYSDEYVSYVEAKGYRLKFSVSIAIVTIFGLFLLGAVNNSYGDFLGLGIKTTGELATENSLLKQQLKEMTERMNAYSSSLNSLAGSDNQLRSIVNLPKIDLDPASGNRRNCCGILRWSYFSRRQCVDQFIANAVK